MGRFLLRWVGLDVLLTLGGGLLRVPSNGASRQPPVVWDSVKIKRRKKMNKVGQQSPAYFSLDALTLILFYLYFSSEIAACLFLWVYKQLALTRHPVVALP